MPSSVSLIKMLKSTSPKTDPWGAPLVTGLYPDIEPLINPLAASSQPILNSLNSPSVKSIPLQFREKDVVRDHVKGFAEVQVDDICCPSPVH